MSRKCYSILLAIVLLAGILPARVVYAAVTGAEIEPRKKEVIRESLQKLGQPTENAALLEAAAHAEALLEITLDRGVRETRVTILTTDEPAYESFSLNGRNRVVVDIYNTINFHSGETYELEHPSVIKSVRTSLFQLEPQFASRVVLDLDKTVDVRVAQQGNTIQVVVPEEVEIPAAVPAVPEKPAELAQVQPEAPVPDEALPLQELEEKLAHAAAEAAEHKVTIARLGKELDAERAADAAAIDELKQQLVAERDEALAEAQQRVQQLEQALAESAEAGEAEKPVAEIEDLRKQLDFQKEAYAELKASFDTDMEKQVSELQLGLQAELEKSARQTRKTIEAQQAALAEIKEQLAAEAAEKERLSKELAQAQEQAATRNHRRPLGTAAVPPALTEQKVSMNFKEAPLVSVLDILKRKANINLLAGGEVKGTVTAMLDDVPLMKAIELVLRENGYGMVYEEGIYRVVPLKLAEEMGVATTTETFKLEYALASDLAQALKDLVTTKGKVVANDNANVVIVTDDPGNMSRLADVIEEIDVPPTIVDTMTGTFRLSYLQALPTSQVLEKMVTENGTVIAESATNSVILTDTPANFQVVSDLIATLDQRPDQVYIEVLMVDAVLSDASEFGVDWLAEAVRVNRRGNVRGNVSQLDFDTNLPPGIAPTSPLNAGILTLGILSGDFNLQATIAAEVQSRNAAILADPTILVVNNEEATIEIVTEVPFQEITQSTQGPPVASTEFKDIGTTLSVSPRITHENTVILQIRPEESSISGFTESGIPIEDSRRADTSILLNDGQTAVVGGLRNVAKTNTVTKVPWLGDIPFFGRLFRNTVSSQTNTELLVFLTVHIVKGLPPELTPYERSRFTEIDSATVPDSTRALWEDMKRPWTPPREPFWKRQGNSKVR